MDAGRRGAERKRFGALPRAAPSIAGINPALTIPGEAGIVAIRIGAQ
jgi:hypothetical protein